MTVSIDDSVNNEEIEKGRRGSLGQENLAFVNSEILNNTKNVHINSAELSEIELKPRESIQSSSTTGTRSSKTFSEASTDVDSINKINNFEKYKSFINNYF